MRLGNSQTLVSLGNSAELFDEFPRFTSQHHTFTLYFLSAPDPRRWSQQQPQLPGGHWWHEKGGQILTLWNGCNIVLNISSLNCLEGQICLQFLSWTWNKRLFCNFVLNPVLFVQLNMKPTIVITLEDWNRMTNNALLCDDGGRCTAASWIWNYIKNNFLAFRTRLLLQALVFFGFSFVGCGTNMWCMCAVNSLHTVFEAFHRLSFLCCTWECFETA